MSAPLPPWLGSVGQVVDDLEHDGDPATRVPEPVLISHAVAAGFDVLAASGSSVAWAQLPGLQALVVSVACLVVGLVVHAVSWWVTRGKVRPLPESSGRHAA